MYGYKYPLPSSLYGVDFFGEYIAFLYLLTFELATQPSFLAGFHNLEPNKNKE
jgi:hypothetical protein